MQVVEKSSLESFATDEFRDRSFFFFFSTYVGYNLRIDGNFSNLKSKEGKLSVICLERNSRFRERDKALGCDSRHSYPND